jgi:hypothetical protein
MVLGFKKQFVEPILQGTKIHTIRLDLGGRWKEGNSIQFATGVRTSDYNEFKTGVCFCVQEIEIIWNRYKVGGVESNVPTVTVDGVVLSYVQVDDLAKNDGFENLASFFKWEAWDEKNFSGKIIHWTNKRY